MSALVQEEGLLVRGLLSPTAYPFPCRSVELVETHISWVFLTGVYAYKVKKPVNMGFLDFSTLEQRRHFCHEELRLNSRLAGDLYIDVVPITGSHDFPEVEGQGEPFEWAVKMHQFDQAQLLSHQVDEERLQSWQVDRLADVIADFHERALRSTNGDPHGTAAITHQPALENFDVLERMLDEPARLERLAALRWWTETEYRALIPLFSARKSNGFVRECHGDLHLGNVAQIGDQIVPFDGIEFNEPFRWIDVMSEIAFLFTDLEHRGHRELAWRMLSRYLETSGDFAGLRLLRYYNLYRVMVRTKVEALRLGQPGVDEHERRFLQADIDRYLRQAESVIRPRTRALILTRGLSGSGKSFLSLRLLQALGAVRVRSDVERKRLFGLSANGCSGSDLGAGLYTAEATDRTFARLLDVARQVLEAGFPVIVDATFLEIDRIRPFRALASRYACPYRVVDLLCPEPVLRDRLARRSGDASEAGQDVLTSQLSKYGPLDDPYCVPIPSTRAWDGQDLLDSLHLKV